MKSSEYFIKFINDTIPVDIDYKKIKENIIIDTKEDYSIISPKKNIKLGIIILTFALTVLALVVPFVIPNNPRGTQIGGDSSHYYELFFKSEKLISKYFDKFVAYGPDYKYSGSHPINIGVEVYSCESSDLIKHNILSSEEITKLLEYENNSEYTKTKKYGFYFGTKDGNDIILIKCHYYPYDEFIYEANLNFSFSDIIDEFEQMVGEKITDEFLINSETGIFVDFIVDSSDYKLLFFMDYDGETYKIIK